MGKMKNPYMKYIKKADNCFRLLLSISFISVCIYDTFLTFFIYFIFPFFISFKVQSYILFGFFIMFLIILSIKRWKKNWFKEISLRIVKFRIHLSILFVWIGFIPTLITLGVSKISTPYLKLLFLMLPLCR
jgi:hypothetical protein